ncbi:hypothetical protein GCM10011452_36580 [Gemmobacter lanyuensis]|uniref:LicD family protein n=1 Tax=Gemmobacter lanyuensis TaxID=1054497 RepID=A0A918MPT4_9RHOB|nr:LicD family protein [Gemmobacter lanyuensis]GGW45000.1 hypothetical protein GCM10011452_36580 [Gemmobacter lanyuensis]
MKIALPRRIRFSRFLNMPHARWTRLPLGGMMWLFTLLATAEPVLAREMARRIIRQDQFHRAARRASFYARRSWMRLHLSRDMIYVFCNQMTLPELAALRRFLERRAPAHPAGLVACDLAYVSGMAVLEEAAADPRPENPALQAALEQFRQDADRVLEAIRLTPADLPDLPEEKDRDGFALDRAAVALADFAAEMDRAGAPWFVLSGTLLGIVREGGFLPHDYDIDAGIMADTVDPVALRARLNAGGRFRCTDLEWQTSFDRDGAGQITVTRRPVFMKVCHANGIYIDIFVHYREGGVIWHASSLFRWDNSDFTLSRYELAGTPVLGPADADRYLTENYGTWRIPVTEFNSAFDTTNQSVVRNPLSVAIFLRRIWMGEASNPRGAEALRRALARGGFIAPTGPEGQWQAQAAAFAGMPDAPLSAGAADPEDGAGAR